MWHPIKAEHAAAPAHEDMLLAIYCMRRPDGVKGSYSVSRIPMKAVMDADSVGLLVIWNSVN